MKSLVVLAATAGLTWATAAAAWAAPALPANVNFSSAQGLPFSLVLDGRQLTNPVARQVHVGQLVPGRHWADFSLTTPYGQPMSFHTTVWLEPGLETSYVIVLNSYGPQLQRVSAVAVGGPVYGAPGSVGAPPYGGPGQNSPYPGDYQQPATTQPPLGTYGNGAGNYPPATGSYPQNAPYGGNPTATYPAPPAPTAPGTYSPDPAEAPAEAAPAPDAVAGSNLPLLPPAEVDALAQELHDHPSDNARLGIAKQALAQNSVRAEDLAQLLSTFNLDKSRIALAEYGYEHVSDPENFSVVYEVFHLPSSAQEVQQALGLPAQ